MRRAILYTFLAFTASLFAVEELSAQAQIRRTEFICYDKRDDANKDIRTNIERYIAVEPTLQFQSETGVVRAAYEQSFEVEPSWNDYNTYLHIENVGADYTIFINGMQIASTFDQFTPSEFFISPYLDQGTNTLAIVVVEEPYMSRLDEGLQQPQRTKFENSYIFSQRQIGRAHV